MTKESKSKKFKNEDIGNGLSLERNLLIYRQKVRLITSPDQLKDIKEIIHFETLLSVLRKNTYILEVEYLVLQQIAIEARRNLHEELGICRVCLKKKEVCVC